MSDIKLQCESCGKKLGFQMHVCTVVTRAVGNTTYYGPNFSSTGWSKEVAAEQDRQHAAQLLAMSKARAGK